MATDWRNWSPNLVGLTAAAIAYASTGSLLLPLTLVLLIACGGFFGGRAAFQAAAKNPRRTR